MKISVIEEGRGVYAAAGERLMPSNTGNPENNQQETVNPPERNFPHSELCRMLLVRLLQERDSLVGELNENDSVWNLVYTAVTQAKNQFLCLYWEGKDWVTKIDLRNCFQSQDDKFRTEWLVFIKKAFDELSIPYELTTGGDVYTLTSKIQNVEVTFLI